MNTEIKALGNMLAATTPNDAPRLLAISKRVAEIAAANPGTVTDQEGTVHLEAEPPCKNCDHPGPETFQNGAWRCPECFGMGWVPSKTEADTDPCPKCEGGFSPQNAGAAAPPPAGADSGRAVQPALRDLYLNAQMNEELIAKLKKLARRQLTDEDEEGNFVDVVIDDYAGGNVDDAYELGERDGKTQIAREVLFALNIPFA